MARTSQRVALQRMIHRAVDQADKRGLALTAEVLATEAEFTDERDALLITMGDAGITSDRFPTEQAQARADRDAGIAMLKGGIAARKAAEAGASADAASVDDDRAAIVNGNGSRHQDGEHWGGSGTA